MPLRFGLKTLSQFCSQTAVMLEGGIPLRRALAVSERSARPALRAVYRRLGEAIEGGAAFTEALETEGPRFPTLLTRLVRVGETAGVLDLVLRRLSAYYDFLRRAWMSFITQMVYPILQFWAMIFILAGFEYVKGMLLPDADPNEATAKALLILLTGVLVFFGPIVLYFVLTRMLGGTRMVHTVLMRVPMVSAIMRYLSLARFTWCMEMMTDAGVRIIDAVNWSMEATTNHYFIAKGKRIQRDLEDGLTMSEAFTQSKAFPYEFLQFLETGEESGSMTEMFGRMAKMYFEKAETALKALAITISTLLWITVACVIIYFIITLAMGYIGQVTETINSM